MDFENPERTAKAGIEALRNFLISIGMPKNFEELGAKEEDIEAMAQVACYGDGRDGSLGGFVKLNTAKGSPALLAETRAFLIRARCPICRPSKQPRATTDGVFNLKSREVYVFIRTLPSHVFSNRDYNTKSPIKQEYF
jgi:hypothetical protein